MSIKLKLQSKQMQSLVLTPQMRQAIHILQLNNLELNEFLAEQVNENPFLEIQDSPRGFLLEEYLLFMALSMMNLMEKRPNTLALWMEK